MISHGASPLALSRRKLTPLDVITAYEDVPGRQGAITLLREAMRATLTYEEKQRMIQLGWRGDERREMEKRKQEKAELRRQRKARLKEEVTSILEEELGNAQGKADVSWGMGNEDSEDEIFEPSDLEDEDSDGYDSDTLPVMHMFSIKTTWITDKQLDTTRFISHHARILSPSIKPIVRGPYTSTIYCTNTSYAIFEHDSPAVLTNTQAD